MPVIGMLGLGEAGGLIAADLRAAGATVHGYDPLPETRPDAATPTAAAAAADVVLSLTTAAEALDATRSVLTVLRAGRSTRTQTRPAPPSRNSSPRSSPRPEPHLRTSR